MRKLIQVLVIVIVAISLLSCEQINGDNFGEFTVFYYGTTIGNKIQPGDDGFVYIPVDVDGDGETDFDVVLANSLVSRVNDLKDKPVSLRVVSTSIDRWYVVEILTQPNLKDYINLEEKPDTTNIILK